MLRYATLQAESLEVQNARDALFFSLGKLTWPKKLVQVSGEYFQLTLKPDHHPAMAVSGRFIRSSQVHVPLSLTVPASCSEYR